MFQEYLRALSLILFAEMGDKTQVIAIAFATQYLIKDILLGVALGAGLNHALAIVLGAFLTKFVPIDFLGTLAGFVFIYFGIKSLEIEDEEDEEESKKNLSPILTVALAFFIGELGDKTQLSALTLSLDSKYPIFILLGTTSGMILTSLMGIIIGKKLGKKIPEFQLKIAAFLVFVFFGIEKLFSSPYRLLVPTVIQITLFSLLGIALLFMVIEYTKNYKKIGTSKLQRAAESLHLLQLNILSHLDNICINQGHCEHCIGNGCVVNYMKELTNKAIHDNKAITKEDLFSMETLITSRSHDKEFASVIIHDIESYLISFPEEKKNLYLKKIIETCEKILSKK